FPTAMIFDLGNFAPEEFRGHRPPADRMLHFAIPFIEDDSFARVFTLFAANLGKESGKAVVIVHGPAIERMIVALGALDAHAHENLRRILGGLESVSLDLVIICRRISEGAPGSGDQFLDNLIQGHVSDELILQPVVVLESGFWAELVLAGANLQKLGP